jgi:ribosomal protein S27AE
LPTVAALSCADTDRRAVRAPSATAQEAAPTPGGSGTVRLRPVDGGPNYYARFPNSLPSDPTYFPVGVWFESVVSQADVDMDKGAGLNLYVVLTGDSSLPLISANGMKVMAQHEDWLDRANARGSEAIAGWVLSDETDMQVGAREGFAMLRSLRARMPMGDGRLHYNNFGKGVTFWNSDAEAAKYVSRFQDVVSADNYWFTDNNICARSEGGVMFATHGRRLRAARCHRAANYGRTVDRLRRLMRPARSRPVWSFVEVGHPSSGSDGRSIRPVEIRAAVWSGLIHGARGVVYFNHSFGGPIPTQHVLREPGYDAVRAMVARTNARIHRLAPVLNAPFAEGLVRTTSPVDTMAKYAGGSFYIFAGSRAVRPLRTRFRVPCTGDATVTVVDENRTLSLTGGSFTDSFADGNAVHIYRIDGGSTCGLPAP